MYKFMFFAFVLSAVYPSWPNDAITGSQRMIADFRPQTFLVGMDLPEQDANTRN